MKNSFVLYTDYKQHLDLLTTEEKGKLLDALFAYAEGEEVDLNGMTLMAFSFIKAQMERDAEKYQEICEKRKEAGSKGGAPVGNTNAKKQPKQANGCINKQNNQKQAKQPDTDNDNETDTETDTENDTETDIKINYQLIADMYNDTCVSYPKVTKLSDSRKKAIKARLKKYSPDDLKRAFELAEQSDFLKGNNNRNWSANFDWIMKDSNLAKVLDGNYKNKSPSRIEMDDKLRDFIGQNEPIFRE